MSKQSFTDAELLSGEVTPITEEETHALVQRANMGEFLDAPSASGRMLRPDFIKISKDTANATLGKDNYQVLHAGETTDVVILRIDQLMYMKQNPAGPMLPPIKYTGAQAAIDAGERLEWGSNSERPTVDPYRDLSLLIKAPGDANPAFSIELGDGDWAPGIYSCGRTGYLQNMKGDEGILKTIRFYVKNGCPLYQLLWTVQPVLHKYQSGFTAGYLKFALKKKMSDTDPVFLGIKEAVGSMM